MIPEGYVQALVDYAEAIEDVTPLETERDALFSRMTGKGKEGKTLVNADLNNKQFGWQVSITIEEKFTAFVEAIKRYNGTAVPLTYAKFAYLIR